MSLSTPTLLFLVGYMGSGKSTIGRRLAKQLDCPFIDLDQAIVDHVGCSIPAFFAEKGEVAFRLVEREVLHQFQRPLQAVIATGGGTPCFFDNMEWMKSQGIVLYLKHHPKSLFKRLNQSDVGQRPVLGGLTGEELYQQIEERLAIREPFYAQSHKVIDQLKTPVSEIVSWYKSLK
jgi:shikimate kinase